METVLTRNCDDDNSDGDNENINKFLSLGSRRVIVVLQRSAKSKQQGEEQDDCGTKRWLVKTL